MPTWWRWWCWPLLVLLVLFFLAADVLASEARAKMDRYRRDD